MAGPFYALAELPVPHSRNLFMSRGWESTDLHLPASLCADPEPLLPALAVRLQSRAGSGLRPLHPAMYTSRVMQVFAILPAAGMGTRMAGPQPKQFLSLDGIPILIHSLRAFAEVRRVSSIWVAVRKPEMERVQAQVAEFHFGSRVEVVEGGENRQESVAHALAALPADEDDIVLVHDAVRPLIDAATIERTIDAVVQHGAAIVGMPAVDTIKQVERTAHGALITSTIPREFIVLAQTPQGFRYGVLKSAFTEAMADGFVGTDEASVVERAGHPVAVVPGSPVNLKITQPGDLELAEFYLRQRMPAGARNLG
jgi:2-C-methyl-D-erythritol 4-phosphate cytidylyltransferase